jgi:hypothetical protein
MEHAHATYRHGDIILTVDVNNVHHLTAIIDEHGEDRISAIAADRLAIWGTEIDCSDADPYWCAAVLLLYPLLIDYLACGG